MRRIQMNILKIEPTPNPNTMKVVLDEHKEDMKSSTHTEVSDDNPEFINRVLEIEEVTSVFYALDLIPMKKDLGGNGKITIPKTKQRLKNAKKKKSTARPRTFRGSKNKVT